MDSGEEMDDTEGARDDRRRVAGRVDRGWECIAGQRVVGQVSTAVRAVDIVWTCFMATLIDFTGQCQLELAAGVPKLVGVMLGVGN